MMLDVGKVMNMDRCVGSRTFSPNALIYRIRCIMPDWAYQKSLVHITKWESNESFISLGTIEHYRPVV